VSAVRLALLTGASTAASFGLFYLWLRSPLVLALLGAALFGTVFMMVGASLGDDPVAADEAWRLEAGDLAGGPAGGPAPDGAASSVVARTDGPPRATVGAPNDQPDPDSEPNRPA
jgi:hypothetical protein